MSLAMSSRLIVVDLSASMMLVHLGAGEVWVNQFSNKSVRHAPAT